MLRKIGFLFCIVLFVNCGSKKSTLTGKKIKEKELVSKTQYRTQLKKVEVERKKEEREILEATSRLSVTTDMIRDYIIKYKDVAKSNMTDHGIPASITLAQGVLESGSGQGTLSRNANNHFGIKCHQGWEGESVRHTDDAPDECFRKYANPEESYRDHSLFLVGRSRYNDLFRLEKDDYKGWAHGLKKAGYATDPRYADKLISIIERYSLYDYDIEVVGKRSTAAVGVSEPTTPVKETKKPTVASKRNQHVVQKGETLYSISKKYNMTVAQVQKINKLSSTSLSIGQILKLK